MTVIQVDGALPLEAGACRVIAEAGANHNNSVERAIELARRAAAAGAWAVKYQLYKAERLAMRDAPKYWQDDIGTGSQFEAYKLSDRLEYDQFAVIADACRELGIVFFATPFDMEAIDALESVGVPLYKIASADITHKPLLQAVASTGKPILISTGAASVEEIDAAISWTGLGPDRLCLLACTLTYPTPDEDGNFARIIEMQTRFAPYLVGMSDHTLGTAGGWMTAALGGVCIEKHYTLDKSLPDVPDHAMSVDPDELRELVAACDRGAVLRGSSEIGLRASEAPARQNARRSIVLARDVAAGSILAVDDLAFKRPGIGLPPSAVDEVVGRELIVDLREGDLLASDNLS